MTDLSLATPLLESIARLCRLEFQVRQNGKLMLRTTAFQMDCDAADGDIAPTGPIGDAVPYYRQLQTPGMAVCGVPLEDDCLTSVWLIALVSDQSQETRKEEILPLLLSIVTTLKDIRANRHEIDELAKALSQSFEELALYRRLQPSSGSGTVALPELPDIFNSLLDILDADVVFGRFPDRPDLDAIASGAGIPDWGDIDAFAHELNHTIVDLHAATQTPYLIINNSANDPKFATLQQRPFRLLACRAAHNGNTYGWLVAVASRYDTFFKRSHLNLLMATASQAAWVAANSRLHDELEALTNRVADFRHDLGTTPGHPTGESRPKDHKPADFINRTLSELSQKIEAAKSLMLRNSQMADMGQMTAVFAHEIKQPLCALDGLIQIAQLANAPDNPQANLKQMANAVRKMSRVIKRFESFSKPTQHQFESLSLNRIAREIYQFVKPELDYKQIEGGLDRAVNLPNIVGDAQGLQQVGLNLVTNAIQAMKTGNGHRSELQIKTYRDDGQACLAIIDNGEGIPEDMKQKIVEPYFSTKPSGMGTGLGLAVATDIIEQHNGQLNIDSKPGSGSQFTIKIPIEGDQ